MPLPAFIAGLPAFAKAAAPIVGAVAPMLKGETMMGGIAPSFMPGQMGAPLGDTAGMLQKGANGSIYDLINAMPQPDSTPVGPTPAEMGPPAPEMGPPTELMNEPSSPFSGFFGNLDRNLQSPSKVLGLGLLGQLDQRLPLAGLLGMGLMGKK